MTRFIGLISAGMITLLTGCASTPMEAPLTSSNHNTNRGSTAPTDFQIGESSVTVEKMVRQQRCDPGPGANLISKKGTVEKYNVSCVDGRQLQAYCEYRQCALTAPSTASADVAPGMAIDRVPAPPSAHQNNVFYPVTTVAQAGDATAPTVNNNGAQARASTQITSAPSNDRMSESHEKPLHAVASVGITTGGDKLVTSTYVDGSTASINAGSGAQFSAGIDYKINDDFSVQGTVGYEIMSNLASNGRVSFTRYPIEFLAYYSPAKSWRIGGGARFVERPKLTGSGFASSVNVDFDNTVGGVLEVEYFVNKYLSFKLRAVKESYKPVGFSETIKANQIGFFTNFYF